MVSTVVITFRCSTLPICCPCLVAAGVGPNSRTVDAQFRKLRDTHADRDAKHLPVDVLEFLLMLATEVADGAVVDGAARDEPHEIDRVSDLIFNDSRTPYAADHGKQENLAQDAGVNRRLADFSTVLTFPGGPVEPVENLIEQPDGMLDRNSFFEAKKQQPAWEVGQIHAVVYAGKKCPVSLKHQR